MKNFVLSFPAVTLTGAVILLGTSCDKQEPAAAPPVIVASPVVAAPANPMSTPPAEAAPAAAAAAAPAANPALETFKAEIQSIKVFMEKNQGSSDATVGLANLRELVRRASAVKTEGLPGDLASAFQSMSSVMQRVQTTLDSLPVPVEKLQAHLKEQEAKGGGAAVEAADKIAAFSKTMEALSKEGATASAKLKEVGAKYGIASLDLGAN